MEKIFLLIQTEKELISVNQFGSIIGRINSSSIVLGYDEEQVILLFNGPDLLFTCESRWPNLTFNQLYHEPINVCMEYLSQASLKHFPLYSFRFTQKDYSDLMKHYSVLENNERKINVWKCAYSHVFDFLNFVSENNLQLSIDFQQVYLELFEYEIEQDVIFRTKKRIHTRLKKIYGKIVDKCISKNNNER